MTIEPARAPATGIPRSLAGEENRDRGTFPSALRRWGLDNGLDRKRCPDHRQRRRCLAGRRRGKETFRMAGHHPDQREMGSAGSRPSPARTGWLFMPPCLTRNPAGRITGNLMPRISTRSAGLFPTLTWRQSWPGILEGLRIPGPAWSPLRQNPRRKGRPVHHDGSEYPGPAIRAPDCNHIEEALVRRSLPWISGCGALHGLRSALG